MGLCAMGTASESMLSSMKAFGSMCGKLSYWTRGNIFGWIGIGIGIGMIDVMCATVRQLGNIEIENGRELKVDIQYQVQKVR